MKKTKHIEPPVFDARGYQTNIADINGEPLPDPAAHAGWRSFHGGAREGAGRKPTGNVSVMLRLPPEVAARELASV